MEGESNLLTVVLFLLSMECQRYRESAGGDGIGKVSHGHYLCEII